MRSPRTRTNNRSFDAIGVNDTGTISTVQVYVAGEAAASVPMIGQRMLATPAHIDLTRYSNVTRVDVTDITDEAGLGLDNIAFHIP